jgi:hypothetical protein
MNDMDGWISLHRKLLEKGFARKTNYLSIWVYLLLKANHKDMEIIWNNEPRIIKRGECIISQKGISEYFRISIKQVFDILNFFKKENQIEKQSTNLFTYISIVNYDLYQSFENQIEKPSKSQVKPKEKPSKTNNNDNNDNNEINKEIRAHKLQIFISEKYPSISKMKSQLTYEEAERLATEFDKEIIKEILDAMENKIGLEKHYKSVNLTIRSWIKLRKTKDVKQDRIKADYSLMDNKALQQYYEKLRQQNEPERFEALLEINRRKSGSR